MSRDPIGEDGGPNLNAFSANVPVNRWDPLGLAPVQNPCPSRPGFKWPPQYFVYPEGFCCWYRSLDGKQCREWCFDENDDPKTSEPVPVDCHDPTPTPTPPPFWTRPPKDWFTRPRPKPQPGPGPKPSPTPIPGCDKKCPWTYDTFEPKITPSGDFFCNCSYKDCKGETKTFNIPIDSWDNCLTECQTGNPNPGGSP